MKLHDYIITYYEEEGMMLFNPINEAIIFFPHIKSLDVDDLAEKDKELLLEKLFFSDGIESLDFVTGFYERIKYSRRKITLIIHTNYSCNLSCSYCYQQGSVSRHSVMSQETIQNFGGFFNKIKENNLLEVVDFCFIGGEPLICSGVIEQIYDIAKQVFGAIKITSTLVTNGTLLTSSLRCLDKINFDCIQVTIDGPSYVHNKFRKSNKMSERFEGIIANLKKIQSIGHYNVVININLTKESSDTLNELLENLKIDGINYPVIFSMVFSGAENDCSNISIPLSDQPDAWYNAHVMARNYGYNFAPLYRLSRFSCGLYKENSLCISPDGMIYKCISGMELKKYYISSIKDYGTMRYFARIAQMVESPKECKKAIDHSCPYALICDGGCSFKSSIYGWHCQYNSLKEADIRLLYRQVVDNYRVLGGR